MWWFYLGVVSFRPFLLATLVILPKRPFGEILEVFPVRMAYLLAQNALETAKL